MTDKWRVPVLLDEQMEDALYDLRKSEEFRRMSFSKILGKLVVMGLKAYEDAKKGA